MKFIAASLVFVSIAVIDSFGQNSSTAIYSPKDYSIVPAAPTVTSFMEFKDFPVDYFHGVPQISFPVYTLKVGAIEVPLTISYHGGGLRTNQRAGNLGHGWTLNCGAEIQHTVYGAPDDANDNIHGLAHLTAQEKSFRSNLIGKKADYDPSDGETFQSKHSWQATDGERYYRGLTDVANDIYSVYGLGLSATFAYEDDGKIVKSAESPMSIQHGSDIPHIIDGGCDGHSYMISTPSGLTYNFVDQDRTKYNYRYGSPKLDMIEDSIYYASSWHLSSITDLHGNKITYHYKNISEQSLRDIAHTVYRSFSDSEVKAMYRDRMSSVSSVTYYPKILDYIEGAGIKIYFHYNNENGGYNYTPLITKIIIEAKDGSRRVLDFRYKYNDIILLTDVYDSNDRILSFEYQPGTTTDYDVYYDSQDFGGYNNEIDNGNNLVPTVNGMGLGADRSVVPDAAKKGVLTRIMYPTGGYTQLEWESNDFKYLNSTSYHGAALGNVPIADIKVDTLRMCLDERYKKLTLHNWRMNNGNEVYLDLSRYFSMNPANLYGTDYHSTHEFDEFQLQTYRLANAPRYPHVVVISQSGDNKGKAVQIFFLDKQTIEDKAHNQPILLDLKPGYYDIHLVNPMMVSNAGDFLETNMRYHDSPSGRVYIRSVKYDGIAHQSRNYWCGLRIRRITSSTGDESDAPIYKNFYYTKYIDPNTTSGTVQMLPRYDYMYYIVHHVIDGPLGFSGCEATCIGETAFPNSPIGNISSVEYPEVRTNLSLEDRYEPSSYLASKAEVFKYSSARTYEYNDYSHSDFLSYQPVGSRMYTSRAFYRGNLLSHRYENITGTKYHETKYEYNIFTKNDCPTLTTDAFTTCDFSDALGVNVYGVNDYGIGKYTIIPYNKTIASEDVDESDGLLSSKHYKYFYNTYTDNLDYNLIKSTSLTTSEGDLLETHYTYAPGKGHYLPLIESELTVCGGEVVSLKRTEYDAHTNLPKAVYEADDIADASSLIPTSQSTPASIYRATNTPTYQYRYNDRGNLIEISYKGKPLASYIWGYDGLYPIIEAKDTPYDMLQSNCLRAGVSIDKISGRKISSQKEIKNLVDGLRSLMPSNEISSIYYHWLLGIVEMNNGRGLSSTYEYDKRGRMTGTRDFNNHLINRYDYHYQDQSKFSYDE